MSTASLGIMSRPLKQKPAGQKTISELFAPSKKRDPPETAKLPEEILSDIEFEDITVASLACNADAVAIGAALQEAVTPAQDAPAISVVNDIGEAYCLLEGMWTLQCGSMGAKKET